MNYRKKHIKPKIKNLKKGRGVKIYLFSFLFIFLISVILYFLLFFQKFQISEVNISGNEKINSNDIEQIVQTNINRKLIDIGPLVITTKSIFITDSKKIAQDILNKFPNIKNVKIKRNLPNKIDILIQERVQFAVFCSFEQVGNNCFLIDENGIIFERTEDRLEDTLIITKKGIKEFHLGQIVIEKNIIDMIYNIKNNLEDNFKIRIEEVSISDLLVFNTSEGWQAYFNPKLDINIQITKINLLLNGEILPDDRKNLQYIYLQYKDRAYYK